jgi:hypothetical protein
MAKLTDQVEIESRLLCILSELEMQKSVASDYSAKNLPFADEMKQIREWIEAHNEFGIAYESLVATIEVHPFVLSGKAAISLLEVGLLLKFKTERPKDKLFDTR